MIKLAGMDDVERISAYCSSDPFGCKIYSLLMAYGTEEIFADFWLSTDESGTINAVISRLESTVTVCAKDGINDEVRLFVKMLPSIETAELPQGDEMLIMKLENCEKSASEGVRINDGIYSIYRILCAESEEFSNAEIGAVYVDIHRRIRCGVMNTALVCDENNNPCACAVASLSEDSALISSVTCLKKYRANGYATKAIKALISSFEREHIFLFCEKKMESFYRKSGFSVCGTFSELRQEEI